ncbi:hypothetical protein D3C84_1048500 [compost metagenome]
MDTPRILATAQQGLLHCIHEGAWATDEKLCTAMATHQLTHFALAEEALHRVEHMDHLQTLAMGLGQLAQLVAEDHRGLVAVGVDQGDAPCAGEQR